MTQAERIIGKFKTQETLAGALGCRQSVVAGWKRRGIIPARQQSRVLAAATKLGISLAPSDFFEVPEPSNDSSAPTLAGARP